MNRRFAILLLLLVCGCSRFDLLNATVPRGNYSLTSDLAFGPGPRQKLDVYLPQKVGADTPVVVFFYGGSWTSGKKEDYRFVAEALAARGYIAVLPDYRLLPDVKFPVFMQDAAAAVRWAHYHLAKTEGSPRTTFLMGHSAGAYIAVLLALDSRYLENEGLTRGDITAVAGISGPYVYKPPAGDRLSPASPDSDFDLLARVDAGAPRMLLIHGLADDFVRPTDTFALEHRLRDNKCKVDARYYKGKDHVATALSLARPFQWIAPTLDDVTNFFRETTLPSRQ